ncbi:MAG: tetratricopeptide repeat protein [Spirochaetaceae bacterium]|nr:tetratricopeptide repeat protein [Spirochaetaceae bacterium]
MKIKNEVVIGIVVLICIAGAVVGIGACQTRSRQSQLAAHIIELGGGGTPTGLEDLRKAIALYEKKIEEHVKDAEKRGSYWKILADRLYDKGLHADALDALQQAIIYQPEDTALYYMQGVSASIMAKAVADTAQQDKYYTLAETSFLRSIALNSKYLRPRYSLGVLYAFDLNRPDDAIPHLQLYLEQSPNSTPMATDINAMFVLARAYYMTGDNQKAVEWYDTIIAHTKDPAQKVEADNNKQIVLEQIYR